MYRLTPRAMDLRPCRGFVMSVLILLATGCPSPTTSDKPTNPFRDLPAIGFSASPKDVTEDIVPLGELAAGDEIVVEVIGQRIEAVLLLAGDSEFDNAGRIAGGGSPNRSLVFRIVEAARYFVYIQFDPRLATFQRRAQIVVTRGDSEAQPPPRQSVIIRFADGWLSEPGLWDEEDGTGDEQALLEDITEVVRAGIMERLGAIFDGAPDKTPIDIVDERDPLPSGLYSTVTFSPRRVTVLDHQRECTGQLPPDIALPTVSSSMAGLSDECRAPVVFGEVLECGGRPDAGNRVLDDEAVVYVGSFQGRGENCRFAVINSVNNVILALARTAAHEIGHLVGLYHVPLTDIMERAPTLSFQRELDFNRGQIVLDRGRPLQTSEVDNVINGGLEVLFEPVVLTTIIQDPEFYFRIIFSGTR